MPARIRPSRFNLVKELCRLILRDAEFCNLFLLEAVYYRGLVLTFGRIPRYTYCALRRGQNQMPAIFRGVKMRAAIRTRSCDLALQRPRS